jgi:uroporphyrin-III C-methyltransferase
MRLPRLEPGSVWLVGAGPGDPGLLTVYALNAIHQADIILHDALIGPEILDLARPDTTIEFAGKRGGQASPTQDKVTARIIACAQDGQRVIRLKGGDPFVFGRGHEEVLALAAAKIPYRIVPGITAGLAALTSAGIPATARDSNTAVTLATGHFARDTADKTDWASFARGGQPIVLYMAVRTLRAIADALLEGGLAPDTAVAIIADATTPKERVLETRLDRADDDAAAAGIHAPAIVAIGDIVNLRAEVSAYLEALASDTDEFHGISLVQS